jgi:hypothetical protein
MSRRSWVVPQFAHWLCVAGCQTAPNISPPSIAVPGSLTDHDVELALFMAVADRAVPPIVTSGQPITNNTLSDIVVIHVVMAPSLDRGSRSSQEWYFEDRDPRTVYVGCQHRKFSMQVACGMTPNRSPWRSWTATTSSKTNTPSIERRSSTCSTLARGCDAPWERLPGVMWRGLPRRSAGQPRGHPCLKGRCTAICTLVTCPFPTTSVCPDSWGRLDVRRRRRILAIPGAERPHVPCPMVTARPVVHGVASRSGRS